MNLDGIFYRDAKSSSTSPSSQAKPKPTPTAASTPSPPAVAPPTGSGAAAPSPTTSASSAGLLGGLLGGLTGLLSSPAPQGGILGRRAPHRQTSTTITRSHRRRSSSPPLNRSFPIPQRPGRRVQGPIELLAPWSFAIRDEDLIGWRRRKKTRTLKKRQEAGVADDLPLLPDTDSALNVTAPSAAPPSAESSPSSPLSNPAIVAAASATSGQSTEAAFGFTGIFFSTFFGGHDPTWATPADQHVWFKDFALQINA